jgi:hypothetical protein
MSRKPLMVLALVLGAIVAAGALSLARPGEGPQLKKPGPAGDRLQALLKEQVSVARDEVQTRTRDYLDGRGNTQLLYEAYRRLLQSQLAYSDQKADRTAALEAYLKWAKDIEDYVRGRVEAARYARTELDVATYYRLAAEVRLERARAADASR